MLVEELGVSYARDSLAGAYFLYNGKTCRIVSVSHLTIGAEDLDGEVQAIPAHVFSGWKLLKYPRLGYRRLSNGLWGRVQRTSRSYARGLTPDNCRFYGSDWLALDNGAHSSDRGLWNKYREFMDTLDSYEDDSGVGTVMQAAFEPQYDDTSQLQKVLSGEEHCFIPSARFLVEPSCNKPGLFTVCMDGMVIGSMDKSGVVYGPKDNQTIINSMVNRYAA